MAHYSESGYCAAEEMNRPLAYGGKPGYYGEGGEHYAVRKEYEEIDEVERARRGHYGYGHGHVAHGGGSHHHHNGHAHGGCYEGCHEHERFGGHREHAHGHGHGHGYGGGRPYDACESKYYA